MFLTRLLMGLSSTMSTRAVCALGLFGSEDGLRSDDESIVDDMVELASISMLLAVLCRNLVTGLCLKESLVEIWEVSASFAKLLVVRLVNEDSPRDDEAAPEASSSERLGLVVSAGGADMEETCRMGNGRWKEGRGDGVGEMGDQMFSSSDMNRLRQRSSTWASLYGPHLLTKS